MTTDLRAAARTADGIRTRTHHWTPAPPAASYTGLSGEQVLRAIVAGEIPAPPIASTLGFRLAEVGPGSAVFEGTTGEHLYNPLGSVHGGYLATLLDSALGCAVMSLLPAGTGYTTTQLNVHLVRPVFADTGLLRCEALALHVGRTVATAEARVTGVADGRLYAHGTTTCAVLPPRPAPAAP
ncbi:PaaI family thioesterase [Kitasatospora sp. NPDC048540]|uniref:PaaI family thioesterase n=1 Tax=unclassified Kitasatospora TaxID=2633591 RepID=UPI00053A6389|nr:PaaI family thioesterase [Kitasatospora sp. MBT63]